MTDRELLELAAKAAGLSVQRSRLHDPLNLDFLMNGESPRNKGQGAFPWNPLTDDGDALRLAVKLKIGVDPWGAGTLAVVFPGNGLAQVRETHRDDPYAATRRAIVRAAAEIGAAL